MIIGKKHSQVHPCSVVDALCEFVFFFFSSLTPEPQLPLQQDDSVRPNAFQIPSSRLHMLYAMFETAQTAETDLDFNPVRTPLINMSKFTSLS